MSLVVFALVTGAVAVVRGPAGRSASVLAGTGRAQLARPGGGLTGRAGDGRTGRSPRVELADVVVDVAAQLRAGADAKQAWERVLGVSIGAVVMPSQERLEELAGPGHEAEAAAVVAAGTLAAVLGAPLAQVLDRVADGLRAAASAEGDRRAALAGPRATARVLTGLPALGLGLGVAVGADPIRVLSDGGLGTASLVMGVLLLLVGRWWTHRLIAAAVRATPWPDAGGIHWRWQLSMQAARRRWVRARRTEQGP